MQWIELPSEPHQSLDWSKELKAARESNEMIFWHFKLGLEQPYFPLEDEFRFQALSLALNEFTKNIWPEFQEKTEGICLYRGSADFSTAFSWSEKQKANLESWTDDKLLFCSEAFAIYFQMLAHRLPDEAPIFLLFDISGFKTVSEAIQAVSKERFEHFTVALRGKEIPMEGYRWEGQNISFTSVDSTTGIVFPKNSTAEIRSKFDALLGTEKIVMEGFLSEQWGGLDQLIVLDNTITTQGDRMLKGFCAAGGEVILK